MTATDLIFLALALLTAAAALVDLRTGHIPNRFVLVGLVVGSSVHLLAPILMRPIHASPWTLVLTRAALDILLGILVSTIAPLILFKLGAMGGGDVKLLALVGATTGPLFGLQIEFCAFVVMALYAPAHFAYQGQLLRLVGNTVALASNPFRPRERRRAVPAGLLTALPFGPAVFVSTLLIGAVERWLP